MIIKRVVLKPRKQKVKFVISEHQSALLMPIGDIHYGADDFPRRHFVDHIRWAVDRGTYFLGMGDYLDFAPESQRLMLGPLRDNTRASLDNAVCDRADELAELLKSTVGMWIGMLGGNHTWEFMDGTNVDQRLCKALKADYLGTMCMLRLVCSPRHPDSDVVVVAHHGMGGGTTIGGHLLKPEHILKWANADLVLLGHSHAKIVGSIDKLVLTPDCVLTHRTILVARTGAFLRAYTGMKPYPPDSPAYLSSGCYVEKKALMPSAMGSICFSLGVSRISGSSYWRPVIHYAV